MVAAASASLMVRAHRAAMQRRTRRHQEGGVVGGQVWHRLARHLVDRTDGSHDGLSSATPTADPTWRSALNRVDARPVAAGEMVAKPAACDGTNTWAMP